MRAVDGTATRYDRTTIALHWVTALLVVAQWCIAKMIDWAPRGAPRVPMRSLHLTVGVILVVLIAARIVWRATRGRRLPAADPGALHALAKATHWGLYALVVATLALGLALWWVRGDTWFFVFGPPAYDPANAGLRSLVGTWHETLGDRHPLARGAARRRGPGASPFWRDGVLDRMIGRPGR